MRKRKNEKSIQRQKQRRDEERQYEMQLFAMFY